MQENSAMFFYLGQVINAAKDLVSNALELQFAFPLKCRGRRNRIPVLRLKKCERGLVRGGDYP